MIEMEMPPCKCPSCGKLLDGISPVGHTNRPKPGSLTICLGCLSPLIFKDDMQLRLMTDQEYNMMDDESLALVQEVSREIVRAKARVKK